MRIKKTPLWYLAGDCTSILLTLTNKLSHVKSRTAANYHLLTRVKFNTGKVFCQKFMIGCFCFGIKPSHTVCHRVVHESGSIDDADDHRVRSCLQLYHRHTSLLYDHDHQWLHQFAEERCGLLLSVNT